MNLLPLPLARARLLLVIKCLYFSIFLENLKMADRRNKMEQKKSGGSAVHGITQFPDLSQAEFESDFLTADEKMISPDSGLYNSLLFSWVSERNEAPSIESCGGGFGGGRRGRIYTYINTRTTSLSAEISFSSVLHSKFNC